jgi:diguanylate cyclase
MSSDNIDTDPQSRWKHRYYEALDELEQKEKNWREAERLIRHLISRLTLAADSRHKALTHELNELRNAVRDGRDFLKLRAHIDLITEQVAELDKMRKQEDRRGHPASLFVEVLEKLSLPEDAAREFKQFRKLVKQLEKDAPSDAMNEQFVGLLRQLSQPAQGDDATPSRRQRLLDRILSRQKPAATPESEAEPVSAPIPDAETTSSAEVQEQINQEIKKRSSDPMAKFVAPAVGDLLLQLTMRMPDVVKKRINFPALKKHTNKARTRRDLIPIIEVISQQIEAAYTQEIPTNIDIDDSTIKAVAQAVQQFFEQLDPPLDLRARIAELEKFFSEKHEQIGDLVHCLNSLADVVQEICSRLAFQRNELENFFIDLSSRLDDMDAGLQQSTQLNETAKVNSEKMDQAVHQEMQTITDSMSNEIEIEQLKISIRQRLDAIDQHLQVFADDESMRLEQANNLITQLSGKIDELEVESDKLRNRLEETQKQAMRDVLTGIPNRQAYEERIATEIARCRRYGSPLCLVVWDVDKFKSVNDNFGHAAGDKVLKVVAETLDKQVRATDFLARFGGEEFVLLLPEIEISAAEQVANKLREVIAGTPFHFRDSRVPVTVSAGVAQLHKDEPANDFFERADKALYKAKENGRNRVELAE